MVAIKDYRHILDKMLEGIQIIDADFKYMYVNDALVEQSHYTREQLIGKTMQEKYPGIENTAMFAKLKECMSTKNSAVLENEFRFPDNSSGWFELSIQPMDDNLFILSVDITKRKKAEQELESRNNQLQNINEELQQFAYIASHDLQEPLRTTGSFAQLLEKENRGNLSEKSSLYLNHINKSVSRMKMLITGLLEYSKIGINKNREEVDMNILLNDVLTDLSVLINETKAKIKVESLPVLNAYKTELHQLLQNLIVNAIKFRKKEVVPEIHISAERTGKSWQFCITDNGIGIKKDFFDKIFVIYQRLHTRSEFEGSGLGLAYGKKIAELHGGRIWLESEEGKGSRFYFTIADN